MRRLPVGLLLLVLGCSEAPKAELTPLEKVPDNVMTIAKDKLPDVTFEQAVKRPDGIYEISGKDAKGKVREIEISPSGAIIEIE